MKPKTVVLLAVAVGCGLLAMLGVQQAMSGSNTVTAEETVKVLMAVENIDPGVGLTEENVTFQEVAISAVPKDAIRKLEEYEKRSALFPFQKGDIVRLSKLTEKGGGGRSFQIPKGLRVIAIAVTEELTISGLIQPGDRVDVTVTYSSRDTAGRTITKTMTLLEHVEVFSTDNRTVNDTATAGATASGPAQKTRHVSLLLNPDQVNYVRLAQAKGQLSLAWRHRDDDVLANVGEVNEELLNDLRGQSVNGFDGNHPGYEGYIGPNGNFDALGLNNFAGAPQATPAPVTPPTPVSTPPATPAAAGSGFDALLANANGTPAANVAAVTTTEPADQEPVATVKKNEWTVQIYNGQGVNDQSFELPEEVQPATDEETVKETMDGIGKLLNLFKKD